MNDSGIFSRFWRLLDLERKDLSYIYFYAFLSGIVNLSLPLGIQAIINLIQGGEISTAWMVLVGVVIAGVAIVGTLQVFQLRIVENIRQKLFARSSFEFAYRFPRISLESIHSDFHPELANRFFDTISLQKALPKILIDFSLASLQILIGLILLAFYHPFFIVYGLLLIGLVFLILRISGPSGLVSSLKESREKYQMAHWLEEVARALSVFKLTGNSRYPLNRTDAYLKGYIRNREAHFQVLMRQFIQFIGFKVLVAAGLLIIGSLLVFQGEMNIGQFVAAEIIIIIIISSVEKLILILENVYDVLTSLEKIAQVTEKPLEHDGTVDLPKNYEGMSISTHHLDFSYPDSGRKIFDDLSLQIDKNEKVWITGPNGSGKSTLLRLLSGLYQPDKGDIKIDRLPLDSLNMSTYRSQIGVVLSPKVLFNGSLRDNILVGRDLEGNYDLEWVIDMVDLKNWLSWQKQGLDTPIDPETSKLPKSIVQKILLARAVVNRPRLLLLEDPLEYVDQESKSRIIKNLFNLDFSCTIIIVSKDQVWMEHKPIIIDLDRGKLEWVNNGNETLLTSTEPKQDV
ncbi:MAG: ABC transporter ATP-binding protein [Saprospiraceae bacterium]|nr:ABC transporter ATP-binding protein [Saprospiraceae bacterium]